MLCQACSRFTSNWLTCSGCRRRLKPASDQLLAGGVLLVPAFEHTGPARTLIHHLKYRALIGYADLVAEVLVDRLPRAPIVPVPRVLSRRVKYGVDPAQLLAERLARRIDVPVVNLLATSYHTPRRAGGDHSVPVRPPAIKSRPDRPIILIDDVVTTGATLRACIEAIGSDRVVCVAVANAVPTVARAPYSDDRPQVPSLLRPKTPSSS